MARLAAGLVAAAALLVGCSDAAAPSTDPFSAINAMSQLSPEAEAALAQVEGRIKQKQDDHARLGTAASLQDELARRVELEQIGRRGLEEIDRLSGADRLQASRALFERISALDQQNTAYLKAHLPESGWFTAAQHGEEVSAHAFLIAQHSGDAALMRRAVMALEPLVGSSPADGRRYALLYDRLAVSEGREQRYGTQLSCRDGVLDVLPIEDASKVDQRRREAGFDESLAEYGARFPRYKKSC